MFGRVQFVLLAATLSVAGCQNSVQDSHAPPKTSRLSDEQQAAVKDALKALGRIEGAVKTGVTYIRYGELVGDAQAAVDEAGRVLPSDYWELATALKDVVAEYLKALSAWKDNIDFPLSRPGEVELQNAWSRAGKSLENARLLAEGKPAVKDPPEIVNKPAEAPKVEKPKKPETVPPATKTKKDRPPPPPPPEPTAAELADAIVQAEKVEPAVRVGADRIVPSTVGKAAEALTRLRRARWVSDKYPHSTKAAADKRGAETAWDKASTELGKAKAAALEVALAEAEAEADRKYPIQKTGSAADQVKSRLLREKMHGKYLEELKQAARAKVDADYRLPLRTGEVGE